jgi:hypothetical protein
VRNHIPVIESIGDDGDRGYKAYRLNTNLPQ